MSNKVKEEEFGTLTSKEYLYVSEHPRGKPVEDPIIDEPPYFYLLATYFNYLLLIILGHLRDFFGKIFYPEDYKDMIELDGYAPLYSNFESFYVRRMKHRLDDCFSRPTTGVPGRYITLLDRVSTDYNTTFKLTGGTTACLNLSSYNYLGFAQSKGQCTDATEEAIYKYGTSSGGPRNQVGTTDLHLETEKVISTFLGKEDAMVFSMGYGTNANLFTSLADSHSLVISDELNHASLRFGSRLSGAIIKIFKHNDMSALEKLLREQISQGQPRTHRPWKKIFVVVEGLFSMEGTMCNLPRLVELRKQYKFYLFVDEAHSIGAMGPHGRGVCDYYHIDPSNVDILMGTLTKSFGATGGYIAADKCVIDRLRLDVTTAEYGESMSPPVLSQIISALKTISGEVNPGEGQERLQRLAFNSRYVRLALKRLGFIVYGVDDSPVIPLLLYLPPKMPMFSRKMLKKNIAVVVVGYPAAPLSSNRVRLCLSAALTKEDLDYFLTEVSKVGDEMVLKISSGAAGGGKVKGEKPRWSLEEVLATCAEDAKKPFD